MTRNPTAVASHIQGSRKYIMRIYNYYRSERGLAIFTALVVMDILYY
jgi:hypothetical protein